MKFQIPVSFELLGHEITVEWNSRLFLEESSSGLGYPPQHRIVLQPDCEGIYRPDSGIEETFIHELVHHILYQAGYSDLCDNEKFVTVFSGLLHQALTTMEYGDETISSDTSR